MFEVRASPIYGRGVHALCPLPPGSCLGAHEGRRYAATALSAIDWRQRHGGMTYLFALADGTTIDGAEGDNALRFLNHACEPNCEAVESHDDAGRLVLHLMTVRAVAAGAKLLLADALAIDQRESALDHPCRCARPGCRDSLVTATT